jgi:AcrR family transcriptional regulator
MNTNTSNPVRLTREERRAKTREALLDAAGRVFVERGFAGASVEAIAAAAGYTRGAFYSNFDSKEQLFAELLQERVFSRYREIARGSADASGWPTAREVGAAAAAMQRNPDGGWLLRLSLELLLHAGRDEAFRGIAAEFWTGTRVLGAQAIEAAYAASGREPPAPADQIATAMIAMDVGLTLQRFVDPDVVPLDAYPELYDLVFKHLEPPRAGARES